MKKGEEFISPENVNKSYRIRKDYALKDFDYVALAGGLDLLFIILSPYDLISTLTKIMIVVSAMAIVVAISTVKPVDARKNIKARDYPKTRSQYAKGQRLYFLRP